MTGMRSKAQIAANNNADLCAAILTAHGLRSERDRSLLYCIDEPPPYYPKLVTLEPNAGMQQSKRIRDVMETGQSIPSIKDSFADLDCVELGMMTLFEASWIWHDGGHGTMPDSWRQVCDAAELTDWHSAWSQAGSPTDQVIFPPSVLGDPNLVFLACGTGSSIEAGCIANFSSDVTGLSNVFSMEQNSEVFAHASQAALAIRPGLPVVGYEAGIELTKARSIGFRDVGTLRVLVQRDVARDGVSTLVDTQT